MRGTIRTNFERFARKIGRIIFHEILLECFKCKSPATIGEIVNQKETRLTRLHRTYSLADPPQLESSPRPSRKIGGGLNPSPRSRPGQLTSHSARIENYRRRISFGIALCGEKRGERDGERDRRDIKQAHLYVNKLRSDAGPL